LNKDKKLEILINSPSYKIAFKDEEFMNSSFMRGSRLEAEYNKVEISLKNANVEKTLVLFGSARTLETDPNYQNAAELAKIITNETSDNTIVCSGGGPGIMEAANKGAEEAGGKSIALNIELPFEQTPNQYVTPELCFNFHYFAIRKMHFLLRAKAVVAFPGGFGTLDELFETLTLIQTKKIQPLPIILFNEIWWKKVINFETLIESQTISASDLDLFEYADSPRQAWQKIIDHPKYNS